MLFCFCAFIAILRGGKASQEIPVSAPTGPHARERASQRRSPGAPGPRVRPAVGVPGAEGASLADGAPNAEDREMAKQENGNDSRKCPKVSNLSNQRAGQLAWMGETAARLSHFVSRILTFSHGFLFCLKDPDAGTASMVPGYLGPACGCCPLAGWMRGVPEGTSFNLGSCSIVSSSFRVMRSSISP